MAIVGVKGLICWWWTSA